MRRRRRPRGRGESADGGKDQVRFRSLGAGGDPAFDPRIAGANIPQISTEVNYVGVLLEKPLLLRISIRFWKQRVRAGLLRSGILQPDGPKLDHREG